MKDARELVADIGEALRDIDAQLRDHPYPAALAAGAVAREAIGAFPGHQYHTILSDLRSMSLLVQRFGQDAVARAYFSGFVQGELAALDSIVRLGAALGMSERDLETYEVRPEGFTYATFVAWQSVYASAAEVACGFFVNFAAWGENCGRMSLALREQYGLTSEDTAFLDAFASLPTFEDTVLRIIQGGLDQGVAPAAILRGARLFQAYEKMFWDTMAAIAGV